MAERVNSYDVNGTGLGEQLIHFTHKFTVAGGAGTVSGRLQPSSTLWSERSPASSAQILLLSFSFSSSSTPTPSHHPPLRNTTAIHRASLLHHSRASSFFTATSRLGSFSVLRVHHTSRHCATCRAHPPNSTPPPQWPTRRLPLCLSTRRK